MKRLFVRMLFVLVMVFVTATSYAETADECVGESLLWFLSVEEEGSIANVVLPTIRYCGPLLEQEGYGKEEVSRYVTAYLAQALYIALINCSNLVNEEPEKHDIIRIQMQ